MPIINNQGALVPVSSGTFYTDVMPVAFSNAQLYIMFYDASGNPVTPSAGTIVAECSPDGSAQWLVSANSPSINATSVVAGSATYTPPSFNGLIVRGRVTLSGVTGATQFRAWLWRY